VSEAVSEFGFGEQAEYAAAELPELLGGPFGAVAEQLLELAEGAFNGLRSGE
jgi:hypothetical protein